MILGHRWLKKWNPQINWKTGEINWAASTRVQAVHIATKLAQLAEEKEKKDERPLIERLPKEYHPWIDRFEKETAKRLPEHSPWDHAINLKNDGWTPKPCKIYPLRKTHDEEMQNFIKENLAKGYIRESKSPITSPFFFIEKKDGSLRPVQDYRELNDHTVKYPYPTPRIETLIEELRGFKQFTKLDLSAGFNNVCI